MRLVGGEVHETGLDLARGEAAELQADESVFLAGRRQLQTEEGSVFLNQGAMDLVELGRRAVARRRSNTELVHYPSRTQP